MRVGSLFAGIGGFDLGLERAGMEIVWRVEIDPYCNKILAKHWPNVRKYGDIREVGSHNLERVDLICGGFPCQPFSVAGKRAGKKDNRYLWPEMFRVIQELKPTWVFGENVVGIINMVLDDVLFELEGEGYETSTLIIPACAVNAPHRRDRVWIVAHDEKQIDGENISRTNKRQIQEFGECDFSMDVAYTTGTQLYCSREGLSRKGRKAIGSGIESWWTTEPDVGRVAHGVPSRVDRLKCLGNAVVPQITEIFGLAILNATINFK